MLFVPKYFQFQTQNDIKSKIVTREFVAKPNSFPSSKKTKIQKLNERGSSSGGAKN